MIMRNSVKYISILVMLFLYLALSVCVFANEVEITSNHIEAYVGDTVIVPIKINSNNGFISASFEVVWDEKVLTLIGVEDTGVITGGCHSKNVSLPYILTWENDLLTENITANGTIVNLVFVIAEDAVPGDYSIRVSSTPDGIIDCNGETVDVSFTSGTVTVKPLECEHSWGDWIKSSSSKHKRTCTLCGEVEYERHDWDDGVVVEEPTYESTGLKEFTCETCGGTKTSIIPALEQEVFTVSGSITSFGDADIKTSVRFFDSNGDEVDYYTTSKGSYGIELPNGAYTVTVNKTNHVARTYDLVVDGEDVSLDVKIHLLGDINGDGKITTVDYAKVNSHSRKITLLDGYEFACADINGDGKITTVDAGRINSHSRKISLLW